MKILLDENLDQALAISLVNHEASHVVKIGWEGTKNGELIKKAEQVGFLAILTADKNMRFQQNMRGRSLSLLVLDIHPNVLNSQIACIAKIEEVLDGIKPG